MSFLHMKQPRPPIVTILGHVDHGKTTLLDYIRKSRVAQKEHGGITQRIGAYEVETGLKGYLVSKMTFIDTPGHEAFAKLRARGASVADVAILMIDAKDSVMPQTIESISHIKAAKLPFIVALNKIDLPDANPEKVKNDLLKHEVAVEGKGGHVPTVAISAKTGTGVSELMETILLLTHDLNLTFDPTNPSSAYVIETKKDKRGVAVGIIIKDGTLKVGDTIYDKDQPVKVRSLINDLSKPVGQILPSTPAELLGFTEAPSVGSLLISTAKAEPLSKPPKEVNKTVDMDTLLKPKVEEKKLSLIIKADSQGTLEAITNALSKNDNIRLILQAVGLINKSDVFLAKATGAIVIGFGIEPNADIVDLAKQEKVIIKTYNIIYELLDELQEVADLLKEKEIEEKSYKGEAKVMAIFQIQGEKVVGVKITKGKVGLSDQAEIVRGENSLGTAKLVSLKIRAKPMAEVKKDQEAGMVLSTKLDIRVGDVIKFIS